YSCTHTQWLRDRASAAMESGLPIFVTEWGAAPADGGTNDEPPCLDEGELWHEWMNGNGVSWAAWKRIGCSRTTCILEPSAAANQTWPDSMLHEGHGPFVVEKMRE